MYNERRAIPAIVKNLLRDDCSDTSDALEVYRLFYAKIHDRVFAMLKHYDVRLKTGVFKTSRYIVKYDCYVEMRQLLAYRALGFGINSENKIVTPTFYYIFDSGPATAAAASTSTSTSSSDTESESSGSASGSESGPESNKSSPSATNYGGVKVNIDQLRTLEIQPLLSKSVSLCKWYRLAHISINDCDFIVASIILSIAKSIKYCHDKNLVHGDIKPNNILVVNGPGCDASFFTVRRDSIPETYLIDFGLCGRENTDTGTGGTRPYCAPETMNVNGANAVHNDDVHDYNWCKMTKAQDVWSLGLMLFTMISYGSLFYYYNEFPKRVFDSSGYVRIKEIATDPKIGNHALYPIFEKTLCSPEHRASIDEIIQLISDTLCNI